VWYALRVPLLQFFLRTCRKKGFPLQSLALKRCRHLFVLYFIALRFYIWNKRPM
jgi:hypothetical protein